jgi:hypothetical protein
VRSPRPPAPLQGIPPAERDRDESPDPDAARRDARLLRAQSFFTERFHQIPGVVRDRLLGIDWSGRTCNTINDRTQDVYATAKRLVLQWDADAADGSQEKEAAAWLAQASDALLLRTNDLDRRQSDPIKVRIGLFLAGDWERVWDDFSRDAEAMLEAARVDAPSTPEVGFDWPRLPRAATHHPSPGRL